MNKQDHPLKKIAQAAIPFIKNYRIHHHVTYVV
jgi:hypothetical protein